MSRFLVLADCIGPMAGDAVEGYIDLDEQADALVAMAKANNYEVTIHMEPVPREKVADAMLSAMQGHPYIRAKNDAAKEAASTPDVIGMFEAYHKAQTEADPQWALKLATAVAPVTKPTTKKK